MMSRRAARARLATGVVALALAGTGLAAHGAHHDPQGERTVADPAAAVDAARTTPTASTPPTTATATGTGAPGTTAHADGPVNEMPRRPASDAGPTAAGERPTAGRAASTPTTAGGAPPATTPASPLAADGGGASLADAAAPPPARNCLVTLHGKGGSGTAPRTSGTLTELAPSGNAAGWGGRQWRYDDAASFAQARAIVRSAVDEAGCTRVVVYGFSNGAAFAAKLYCRGESLDGRLVRVIVDDPVTDAGVVGCAPAAGVAVTLYWTGALAAQAPAGWNCADADWTCEGGRSIGIDAYAAALRTSPKASPMGGHAMYTGAPERTQF